MFEYFEIAVIIGRKACHNDIRELHCNFRSNGFLKLVILNLQQLHHFKYLFINRTHCYCWKIKTIWLFVTNDIYSTTTNDVILQYDGICWVIGCCMCELVSNVPNITSDQCTVKSAKFFPVNSWTCYNIVSLVLRLLLKHQSRFSAPWKHDWSNSYTVKPRY